MNDLTADLTTLLADAERAYRGVCLAEGRLAEHENDSGSISALSHAALAAQAEENAEWYRWRLTVADDSGATVECPVLGDLPRQRCLEHQGRRGQFAITNPTRILLYRVCPTCEHRLGAQQ